eukprot:m.13612 g.13612  ORF g.13612 m.13612 type:complete len:629 (+) comp4885_c0_seq1:136-2022(+)
MVTKRIFMLAVILASLLFVCPQQQDSYDALCEKMVALGGKAARLYNTGNVDGAHDVVREVELVFEQAVAKKPDEPQAYANMANFYHNSNKLYKAVTMWEAVLERLGTSKEMENMRTMIVMRRRHSLFGAYSYDRDNSYKLGKGNVSLALEFSKKQLSVYNSPEVLFSMGTLELMLSNRIEEFEKKAQEAFTQAHTQSAIAWGATVNRAKRGKCQKGGKVVYEAKEAGKEITNEKQFQNEEFKQNIEIIDENGETKQQELTYFEENSGVYSLSNVQLSGPEGIILQENKDECKIVLDRPFVNLCDNIRMYALWMEGPLAQQYYDPFNGVPVRAPKINSYEKIASVLQFASSTFYHFIMEVLPRLLLLVPQFETDETLKVLICKDKKENGFQTQLLEIVSKSLPTVNLLKRLVYYDCGGMKTSQKGVESGQNTVRAKVKELILPFWSEIQTNGHVSHSLPPPILLQQLRETLIQSLNLETPQRINIIYTTRAGQTMRQLEEEEMLLSEMKALIQPPYTLTLFNGKMATKDALTLFHNAALVIGVHGGALANIVACPPNTEIVEFGFPSGFTRHYAAASVALGLQYNLVYVQADKLDRGPSADIVSIGEKNVKKVLETVTKVMAQTRKDEL